VVLVHFGARGNFSVYAVGAQPRLAARIRVF
jgi:hypothetical protein